MTDPRMIRRLLEDYEASNLTQRDFAQRIGGALSTFVSWLRKARQGGFAEPSPNWIEAPALPTSPSATASSELILEWPNGVRLHLARDFDGEDAARAMELAQSLCSR